MLIMSSLRTNLLARSRPVGIYESGPLYSSVARGGGRGGSCPPFQKMAPFWRPPIVWENVYFTQFKDELWKKIEILFENLRTLRAHETSTYIRSIARISKHAIISAAWYSIRLSERGLGPTTLIFKGLRAGRRMHAKNFKEFAAEFRLFFRGIIFF